MSHLPSPYYYPAQPAAAAPQPRAPHAGAPRHRANHDYTLVHHGRQVRIGPVAFWIVVGTLVVMGVWTLGTGTYFAFKDDVLSRLIGRQAEMQFAYEDRIAELRSQVDRIASRQLLDQEQVERKVEALMRRQQMLEQRSAAFGSGDLVTGSVPRRGHAERAKPSPISDDDTAPAATPDRRASLTGKLGRALSGGIEGALARAEHSMERVEQALMGLNAVHREAFLLKYVEDLSYDEIAVLTGAGVSALKMRVSRAREFLRAALQEVTDG